MSINNTILVYNKVRWLAVLSLLVFPIIFPASANADCTSPVGVEADMYYNTTFKRVQYCDGTNWVNMGVSSTGTSDNLGDHIATTVLRSDMHNTDDLGTTAIRWKDGWFAGAVTAGSFAGSGASLTGIISAGITDGTITSTDIASDTILASDIAAGAVAASEILDASIVATTELSATGTKNATTFLRGDNTWATPGGGVTDQTTVSCATTIGNGTVCTTADCPAGYIRSGCSAIGGGSSTLQSFGAQPSGTSACYCRNASSGVATMCYTYCIK